MKKCLVVDDSKVIRKVACHMLETLDFSVEEAGDGSEAIEILKQEVPDVVLLDWNMPVMDGMEFLHALKALALENLPKVIFCTTENDADQIRRAMDAGADEYIMKPFDRETLQSKVELVQNGDHCGQQA
ncbi:response regulator [Parasphingopyxis lamellibrachiae]|uniref:Two-component system chemotaxis response regulator CheY n=1 Tax=Parasphingopyxis lamellibrachiae TaxID=680125 RepID=A0A3D9FCQ6_9SPHN|nr:response regulator [Parasphingopyxis lamellibrachiae]RED15448.1 two-component system chemotaxis response regulator CheY [Parasphingopyxis lamellibrachiae]